MYKTSLKFDNPEARLVHEYPLDTAQAEVKDMIKEADNTGHALAPDLVPVNRY
jgi:hypothetical protein